MAILDDMMGGIGAMFGGGDSGSTLGGIVNAVAPSAIGAISQSYANNNINDTINGLIADTKAREQANYDAAVAAAQQNAAASAAGAASRRAAAARAAALQEQYYKKAMKYLTPYIQAGQQVLPTHVQTYNTGMSALSKALGQTMQGLNDAGTGTNMPMFKFG